MTYQYISLIAFISYYLKSRMFWGDSSGLVVTVEFLVVSIHISLMSLVLDKRSVLIINQIPAEDYRSVKHLSRKPVIGHTWSFRVVYPW